ncbi:MAG TPA: hypothetical protein VFW16_14115 [Streptosporangiaceae bacterium]|nr:hypothetical protein [Streptosporangiaceae bacterium]
MIASDTAWSQTDAGELLSEPDRPAAEPVARQDVRVRPEAYRHLWQPPGRRPPPRQAIGQPYVWDGGEAGRAEHAEDGHANDGRAQDGHANDGRAQDGRAQDGRANGRARDGYGHNGVAADEPRRHARRERRHADALIGPALTTERAVIGDLLRELAAWCQIGACIARHTDDAALGEADIRNRAVAAGWCVDLFGRMVCPECQQRYPVWGTRAPVERSRRLMP